MPPSELDMAAAWAGCTNALGFRNKAYRIANMLGIVSDQNRDLRFDFSHEIPSWNEPYIGFIDGYDDTLATRSGESYPRCRLSEAGILA